MAFISSFNFRLLSFPSYLAKLSSKLYVQVLYKKYEFLTTFEQVLFTITKKSFLLFFNKQ